MTKTLMLAVTLAAALSTGSAFAAPCKDAKGKFIKCPAAAAPAKAQRCHDAHNKFVSCKAPGAKPVG